MAPVAPLRPAVPDAAEGARRLPFVALEGMLPPSEASSQPTPADAARTTAEEVPPATIDR